MIIERLSEILCGLAVNEPFVLPLDIYELLFSPGEPDVGARVAAYVFARRHECEINNPTASGQALEVVFIKRVTHPPGCP
jgi:hypothetical protein